MNQAYPAHAQLNEVMEKETYKVARELLEKYDPSNPSLQATPSRGAPRGSTNHNSGQDVRRRRPPSTPHPAFMPHNIAMATPPVGLRLPPVVPVATPAVTNQLQRPPVVPTPVPAPPPVPATPQPSLQHIPPGIKLCLHVQEVIVYHNYSGKLSLG